MNCLRPEPLEWVYEGLTPALPSALLVNGGRTGDLSLAIVYASVVARVGVSAVPVPVGDTGQAQLPAEIAGRYAGLAAAPPPGDAWLLRLASELRCDGMRRQSLHSVCGSADLASRWSPCSTRVGR